MDHFQRSVLIFLLLLTLMCSAALADTIPSLDGDHILLETLPMDDLSACGPAIDPELMTDEGYSDPSIQVTMSREWIGEGHYNVALIRIAHPSQLRTALYNDSLKRVNYIWTIAKQKNAVVATGGEFIYYNSGAYCIRMGKTIRQKGYKGRDTLIIDQHGDFHISKGFAKDIIGQIEEQGLQVVNLFNFGPALIIDGQPVYEACKKKGYPVGDPQNVEPRTAIGQIGPLEYMMVVVDGRYVTITDEDGTIRRPHGASLYSVGEYMFNHGCTQAYALDGGGSTAMYYAKTGIYSKPSSKRGVSDIVYFAALPIAESAAE